MRPHRWQPTRLPRPWDSPSKNTAVGCHFLLQCMKVKSESEVAQSCPTRSNPMDCSPPGSSIHGIFQARILEWGAIAFSRLLSWHFFKMPLQRYIRDKKTPVAEAWRLGFNFKFYKSLDFLPARNFFISVWSYLFWGQRMIKTLKNDRYCSYCWEIAAENS